MSSGKRMSAMICCISPFSRLYIEPIAYYEPGIVHIFISNQNTKSSTIGRDNYKSIKKEIQCKEIVEHNIDTSDYEEILGSIIDIKKSLHNQYGKDVDIFINISSGTPEFSAAGMFASMLPEHAIAFKVNIDTDIDNLSNIIDTINDSISISEPERVTGLRNDEPEDEMIAFLTVVNDLLKKTKHPKYRTIIQELKEKDVWSYDPDRKSGYGRTTLEEKEERYLKRHYIAIALENGWLEKPTPNTMRLTDSGRAYISVYGVECNKVCYDSMPCEEIRSKPNINHIMKSESNKVTFGKKGRRYTFTIEMDQHR